MEKKNNPVMEPPKIQKGGETVKYLLSIILDLENDTKQDELISFPAESENEAKIKAIKIWEDRRKKVDTDDKIKSALYQQIAYP